MLFGGCWIPLAPAGWLFGGGWRLLAPFGWLFGGLVLTEALREHGPAGVGGGAAAGQTGTRTASRGSGQTLPQGIRAGVSPWKGFRRQEVLPQGIRAGVAPWEGFRRQEPLQQGIQAGVAPWEGFRRQEALP